jgi:DNA-binding XRE family transcriptional regulator
VARRDPYYAELAELRRSFAARLTPLRQERFASQEAFGDHARLHRTTIGGLEQGRTDPRLSTLLILADSLKVSVADLVEGMPVPQRRKPPPPQRRRTAARRRARSSR